MNAKNTILINGKAYDTITGLPVTASFPKTGQAEKILKASVQQVRKPTLREPIHLSRGIHQQVQKSSTLRRGHLKAPASKAPVSALAHPTKSPVPRSGMISHFASHPQPLPKQRTAKLINDIGPMMRKPTVLPPEKVKERLSSKEVKGQLIARASETIDRQISNSLPKKQKLKKQPLLQRLKKSQLVTTGVAVLLLASYFAYLNVPGLSVRLAAAQSGVHATYPNYSPDGYSFAGPVAFRQGQVELRFTSNGGGEGYTITQRNSSWNSEAVLDNLVSKASSTHDTHSEGGVTIYTYGTRAAWTNGGVLYTVNGDAPLSSGQLLHIASSM